VRDYFQDIPLMRQVAFCESTYRHFDEEGNVLRGMANRGDVGVMQINEHYHADVAEGLGMDLHELDGNLAYARYLYSSQGVQPWMSSGMCWG
jgi:hypothetical protein